MLGTKSSFPTYNKQGILYGCCVCSICAPKTLKRVGCKLMCNIRVAKPSDVEKLCKIEAQSYDSPWNRYVFAGCMAIENTKILVLDIGDTSVGFIVYTVDIDGIFIWNVAISPAYRLKGLARKLVEAIDCQKVSLSCDTRESNLDAQLFLRKIGFKCNEIISNYYDCGESSYSFSKNDG
jgi:[ribosomal protein S18]-alanine N-acetyltransferase